MLLAPRRRCSMSLLDDVFRDSFFHDFDVNPSMRTDIKEADGNYLMDIDIPGYQKEDIKIELKDGYLIVAAQKNESKEEKDEKGNYIRRERHYGQSSRNFYVGDAVTREDVKASFKDGTLSLKVAKKDPKQIEDQKTYIAIE